MKKSRICLTERLGIVAAVLLIAIIFSVGTTMAAENKVKFHKELPVDVSGFKHYPPRTAENELISITYEVYDRSFDGFDFNARPIVIRYIVTKAPPSLRISLKEEITAFITDTRELSMRFFRLEKRRCIERLFLISCKNWQEAGAISENAMELRNNPQLAARFLITLGTLTRSSADEEYKGLRELINLPEVKEYLNNPNLLEKLTDY